MAGRGVGGGAAVCSRLPGPNKQLTCPTRGRARAASGARLAAAAGLEVGWGGRRPSRPLPSSPSSRWWVGGRGVAASFLCVAFFYSFIIVRSLIWCSVYRELKTESHATSAAAASSSSSSAAAAAAPAAPARRSGIGGGGGLPSALSASRRLATSMDTRYSSRSARSSACALAFASASRSCLALSSSSRSARRSARLTLAAAPLPPLPPLPPPSARPLFCLGLRGGEREWGEGVSSAW